MWITVCDDRFLWTPGTGRSDLDILTEGPGPLVSGVQTIGDLTEGQALIAACVAEKGERYACVQSGRPLPL